MNGGRINLEHTINQTYARTSSIPSQINLRFPTQTLPITQACLGPCGNRVYNVLFTRKENRCPYFKEKEVSVIFFGSHRENSPPFPAIPHRAPRRTFPNTLVPTFNFVSLHRLGYSRTSSVADAIRALLTTDPWEIVFGIIEPTHLELTMELCSTFHLQTVMTNYDDPCMV
ncbi:hypothetical protein GOBAR_AA29510 [Gossypium barbadense]|uniref:Uncharacterized protein n=1 Tax=Gossypium barbadense TaxID=3634 RepID=A0A2P5WJA0_GOSBA|nr:hypothetical protein GOBAR_AA29510 [Gossypium barbadense]